MQMSRLKDCVSIVGLLVAGLLCALPTHALSASSAPMPKPATVASAAQAPQQGTAEHPVVIDLAGSPVIRVEATDKTERHNNFTGPEWALVFVTALLAVYTAMLFRATVRLGKDAKQTGDAQSERMERSVTEAARAATAMDRLATSMQTNTELMPVLLRKQMRAYLTVDFGDALYQDATTAFEARPTITNNGLTPARNVSFQIQVGLRDWRLTNTAFPNNGELIVNDVSIAPRSQYIISKMLDVRIPDESVDDVMEGKGIRLFTWGKVTYGDVYEESWETNFCISYTYLKVKNAEGKLLDVKKRGFYFPKHNSAT